MSRLWIALAVVLWLGSYAAADQPSPGHARKAHHQEPPTVAPAKDRESDVVLVVQLRNAPAMQLANALDNVFAGQQAAMGAAPNLRIVPEAVSNCLVVSGPSELVHQVDQLIGQLDRAPAMIRLEVVMGDVPTADLPPAETAAKGDATNVRASPVGVEEIQKKMEVLFRTQLTTLDNQPAYIQAGRREPTVASVNTTAMGKTISVNVQNLGTKISFTPRANADRVVAMTLDIDDSRLAPADEGVPIFTPNKGEPVRTPVVELLCIKTTIKLADGQTTLLSDMSRQAKDGKQRVVLVTVHVLPIGDQAK